MGKEFNIYWKGFESVVKVMSVLPVWLYCMNNNTWIQHFVAQTQHCKASKILVPACLNEMMFLYVYIFIYDLHTNTHTHTHTHTQSLHTVEFKLLE